MTDNNPGFSYDPINTKQLAGRVVMMEPHQHVIFLLQEIFYLVSTRGKHSVKGRRLEVKAIPAEDGGLIHAALSGTCANCSDELLLQFMPRQKAEPPIKHNVSECRVALVVPGDASFKVPRA